MSSTPLAEGPAPAPAPRSHTLGLATLLGLLVLAAWWRTVGGDFVYDDQSLIRANPQLETLGRALEAFRRPHWGFADPAFADQIPFWRPLTVLALYVARVAGGGAPEAFHLVSLLLHTLATLAAWRLAARLGLGRVTAFLCAACFAMHPVHVESVAWMSAVNDPLFGLFALCSVSAWIGRPSDTKRGSPLVAALFLGLALLSKEQALVVPVLLVAAELLLFRYPRRPGALRAWIPIVLVLVGYWLARVSIYGDLAAGFDRPSANFEFDAARNATLRLELFGGFLYLLALPLDPVVFRGIRPEIALTDPSLATALAASAVFLVLAFLAWRKRNGLALFALAWIAISVLPIVVYFEAVGGFPLSDRYLYLGVLGWCVLLGVGIERWLPPAPGRAALALFGIGYGVVAWQHMGTFEDEERFFRRAVLDSPKVPVAHWGLGRVLLERYRVERELELLDEAFLEFLTSLSLGFDYGDANPKLGPDAPLRERLAEMNRAVNESTRESRRPDPSVMVSVDDRLQSNLGQGWCYLYYAELPPDHDYETPLRVFEQLAHTFDFSFRAWTGLGTTHYVRGEYQEARDALGRALELNRAQPEAWHNLAEVHLREGNWDEARSAYQEALRFRPRHLPDQIGVASCALEAGRLDMAEGALKEAAADHPDSLEPLFFSGMLAARRRELPRALGLFDMVVARQDDHGRAHLQRAKILVQLGEEDAALQAFGRACELMPESYEAYYNLGAMLQRRNQHEQAVPYIVRAYELSPKDETREVLHRELARMLADDGPSLFRLALVAEARGDWLLGLDWIQRAILTGSTYASSADAYLKLGRFQQQLDRLEDAAASLKQALEFDPEHFWGNHDLGVLLAYRMQRSEEAAPFLEKALELLPGVTLEPGLRDAVRATLEGRPPSPPPGSGPIQPRRVEPR